MSNGNTIDAVLRYRASTKKKLKLPLSQKNAEQVASESLGLSRLTLPVSKQELSEAAEKVVPFITKKNNCWAEQMLNAWVNMQNRVKSGSLLSDMLSSHYLNTILL